MVFKNMFLSLQEWGVPVQFNQRTCRFSKSNIFIFVMHIMYVCVDFVSQRYSFLWCSYMCDIVKFNLLANLVIKEECGFQKISWKKKNLSKQSNLCWTSVLGYLFRCHLILCNALKIHILLVKGISLNSI